MPIGGRQQRGGSSFSSEFAEIALKSLAVDVRWRYDSIRCKRVPMYYTTKRQYKRQETIRRW